MSFGFGVGDFIACSKLIKSVVIGLNDATGSAAEIRSLQGVLESIDRSIHMNQVVWDEVAKTQMEPHLVLVFKFLAGTNAHFQKTLRVRFADMDP